MPTQESIKGEWLQLKGAVKEQWGKLTDDDLTAIDGKRDKLVGKLVSVYSMAQDQAQKEVDKFYSDPSRRINDSDTNIR